MANGEVRVGPLGEADLAEADRIFRAAFGAFLGAEDVFGDLDYVRSRWLAAPDQALAATLDGELVGSNFLARWGSVGVFGPLTVRPDLWDRGIAKELLGPTVARFEEWSTTHQGLFTFPDSPKHHGLYQRFGFWPAHLTAVLAKPVEARSAPRGSERCSDAGDRGSVLEACRSVTGAIYPGLDVGPEIAAVADQELGDTVLLEDAGGATAFAVCHAGAGTEAGSERLYVKFGAAAPGPDVAGSFGRLLEACEALAGDLGCQTLVAGVNTARVEAYRLVLERGFRAQMVGVAMQRGADRGYNRPDVHVLDDWR